MQHSRAVNAQFAFGTLLCVCVCGPVHTQVADLGESVQGKATVATPMPPDVPQDWWSAVQRDIAQSEYAISPRRSSADANEVEGYQAPNRAQNFRTLFGPHGIRVIPRTQHASEAPPWEWALKLNAWGAEGTMQPAIDVAEVRTNGNRIEYHREGITEWYINDERGLEQGFTIERRMATSGLLRVELAVGGTVRATLTDENQAVDFITESGARAIRFDTLRTVDARGKALPNWFDVCDDACEGSTQMLSIVVNDADAVYPITIDPLATSPNWHAEGNLANLFFGHTVETAGDVNGDGYSDIIVGVAGYDNGQTDEGRALVYYGSVSGLSIEPNWMAEGNQTNAAFGTGIGTAGDVNGDGFSDVIIGAQWYDNGQTDEGRALVYHGSATGLAVAPSWITESNRADAYFGASVSSAGDINGDGFSDVIVGAFRYTNGQYAEGRAYVYHGSASGLNVAPSWITEGNQVEAEFGFWVRTAGDVNGDGFGDIIVGVRGFDDGQTNEGLALVFHGSATGLLTNHAWLASGNQEFANFGQVVATAGDVNGDGYSDVIVGANGSQNGQSGEGRAFVYHGSGSGLSSTPDWTAESNQENAWLGLAVSTAGDVNGDGYSDVLVSAPRFDSGQTDEGRVYLFLGSATGLTAGHAWTVDGDQTDALFGNVLALAGDVNGDGFSDVIVGASRYDNGQTDEGGVFVYHGSPSGIAANSGWTAEGDLDSAMFGVSVAFAGDVNGDGFNDVIVGAAGYDNAETDEGKAFVYHGSTSGLPPTPNWTAEGNSIDAFFGWSVATAGDVNGDGYSDVIVGAPVFSDGEQFEGQALVYHGSGSGLGAEPSWMHDGNQEEAYFGRSVATAGDVNGDGFSDVIVGAYRYDNGEVDEGRALVYHGSASGLVATPVWTAEGNQMNAWFGICVATAGDVNGDGFSDVIVGANSYDTTDGAEGMAFVYHGSSSGLSASAAWNAEGVQSHAEFGRSVATAGDVNGDGFSDVIVGANLYDNGESEEGRVVGFHGSATGLSNVSSWTVEGDQIGAQFGWSAASAGDVNGDGYSDVIVGAPYYDGADGDEGRAFLYHGSPSGLSISPAWTRIGAQAGAQLGFSVALAGDVNADRYGDVIVGQYLHDSGQTDEGNVQLFYGNGGPGRTVLPRQVRTDGVTTIAPLGKSNSETQFRIRTLINSVYGRTTVSLQHEVKPLGTLFDGTGLVQGAFSDTDSDGVWPVIRLVSGLSSGTHYHWRMRGQYDQVRTPFQKFGPWIHAPTNGWNEADLRTAGTAPTGACCLGNGACIDATTLLACTLAGGSFQGIDLLCSSMSCPQPCNADLAPTGGDGLVGTPDLLALINAWGPCVNPNDCPADIAPPGGNDIVGVPDLLTVINAWGKCE